MPNFCKRLDSVKGVLYFTLADTKALALFSFASMYLSACVSAQNDADQAIGRAVKVSVQKNQIFQEEQCVVYITFDKSLFADDTLSTKISLRIYPHGRTFLQEKFEWNVTANEKPEQAPGSNGIALKNVRTLSVPVGQLWIIDKVTIGSHTQKKGVTSPVFCPKGRTKSSTRLIEIEALPEKTLDLGAMREEFHIPSALEQRADEAYAQGSLTKIQIDSVIKGNLKAIKTCYVSALNGSDSKKISQSERFRIKIEFVINKLGKVEKAKTKHMALANTEALDAENFLRQFPEWKAVEQCVLDVVLSWQFPKPRGGGIVNVSYPFIFEKR